MLAEAALLYLVKCAKRYRPVYNVHNRTKTGSWGFLGRLFRNWLRAFCMFQPVTIARFVSFLILFIPGHLLPSRQPSET